MFRRALIATLQRFAAPRWNETAKYAWETAFNHAAAIMIQAAKSDAAESPAWWIATVTGMELRGPDIKAGDPLVLYYGARRHQDLYDLPALQEMEVAYISGPDYMILRTARVLRERGALNRLIHYDLDPKTGQAV